jgi:hypothetical protein
MKTLSLALVLMTLLVPGGAAAAEQPIIPPGMLAQMFDAASGAKHDQYLAVQAMTQLANGDLLLGVGGQPAISEGAIIVRLTTANEVVFETRLDEQGILDLQVQGGKAYVPGLDPSFGDDWSMGNVYVRDAAGTWTKRRTLPATVHAVGQAFDDAGNWYVAAYLDGSSLQIMRSADDGVTWARSPVLCCSWIEGLGVLAERFYLAVVPHDIYGNIGTTATIYVSKTGWVPEPSPPDTYWWADTGNGVARVSFTWLIPWRAGLLTPGLNFTSLSVVFTDGTARRYQLPFMLQGTRGVVKGAGGWLYVAATDGVYRSRDLLTWRKVSVMVPTALGWRAPYGLLLSDAGDQATLWELDTRSLDLPTAVHLQHFATRTGWQLW